MNCQVGKHFPVERNVLFRQIADELRVGRSVQARSGVDSRDPETTELTLARPPVPESILERLLDRVLGDCVYLAASTPVAFRHVKNLLATAPGSHSISRSWHFGLSVCSRIGRSGSDETLDAILVGRMDETRLTKRTLSLLGLLRQDVAAIRFLALQLA